MATHAKSTMLASAINDVLAGFKWLTYYAYPTAVAHEVVINYHARAMGCKRVVACNGHDLLAWLKRNACKVGNRERFEGFLDRKPECPENNFQPELNLDAAPAIVKRSMGN